MENGQNIRRCKKCGEVKNLTEFPLCNKRSEARRHECKSCSYARVRRWLKENSEHSRAVQRAYYRRNPSARWTPERLARKNELARIRGIQLRMRVLAVYGTKCACCGETEMRFLTVDHVNNDGKDMRKIHGTGASFYSWLVKNQFPPGFQVLCMNCNFGKAMNNGVCPHEAKEGSTTIPEGSTAKRPEVPRTLAAE